MKNVLSILGIFLFSIVSMTAANAQSKLGHVNSASILTKYPDMQRAQANLQAYQKQLKNKMDGMVKSYQATYQDAVQKQQAGQLSPAQGEEIGKKLQQEEQAIAKFEASIGQKLEAKRTELIQPIFDKVNAAIKQVALEKGYSYVFDTSVGTLLYAKDSDDVSALVKAKLGL